MLHNKLESIYNLHVLHQLGIQKILIHGVTTLHMYHTPNLARNSGIKLYHKFMGAQCYSSCNAYHNSCWLQGRWSWKHCFSLTWSQICLMVFRSGLEATHDKTVMPWEDSQLWAMCVKYIWGFCHVGKWYWSWSSQDCQGSQEVPVEVFWCTWPLLGFYWCGKGKPCPRCYAPSNCNPSTTMFNLFWGIICIQGFA